FAARHDRKPAFGRNGATQAQESKTITAAGNSILKHFCRTFELCRRTCFVDGNLDTGSLCVIQLFKIHEVAGWIDDANCHGQVVLFGFCRCRRSSLLGSLEIDWHTVRGGRGRRCGRLHESERSSKYQAKHSSSV